MGKLRRPTKGTSFTLSIQSVGGVGAGCRVPGAGCRVPVLVPGYRPSMGERFGPGFIE